ncbi:MAG TPA: PAS domain S-box protein [Bryobacteraceae bacterium]|nr:PAS domain S-box protein [Bryobacteraceae bacterium]
MKTPERMTLGTPRGPVRRVLDRIRALTAANAALKQDVAERKRIQEETKKQAEILLRIFDHIPVMLSFVGSDGQINLVNREWERTLGWSRDEIRTKEIDVFAECYPDSEYRREMLDFIAQGEARWREFKTRVRDGRVIDTCWAVVHLSDGTRVRIGTDITERKRAEEKLRLSERQLAESQLLAHIGSWNWDIRTNALTWSEETFRILGLDPKTFHPTHEAFLERVHPDDRGPIAADLEKALKTKEPVSYYVRMTRSDGEVRTLCCQGRVVADEQGNPVRMFGYAQDVTAQRLAEEQLKSSNEKLRALSERLQSAREQEGTRIARELHDELGSALTTLKWELEALEPLVLQDPCHIPAIRPRIESMKRLADATINTVRRIASELRPSVLDELGLMEAIDWQAQQFQARTGVVCECSGYSGDLRLSKEQSTVVFRIFQEALTNVLRHAQAKRVEVQAENDANGFVLTIRDDGRGITEEEKASACSLGLLGMRERAQAVGGSIHIAARRGHGTALTVRIQIPTPQ